ncbi:hypothetical protein ACL02S_00740 [Nocardia sp. 004]|uniref:hypothetical protein n=1 Tax=Nocardia sp. 004 TaxID=3385978 RepID=UPI0039A0AF53
MAPGPDLQELRVSVYATEEDTQRLLHRARSLLENKVAKSAVSVFATDKPFEWADQSDDPDTGLETVGGVHDDLPQQWHIENPGLDPGERSVYELRAGVIAEEHEVGPLLEALTGLLCPDDQHPGPCPIPWSASFTTAIDDTDRDYLEHWYGHLRQK